MPDKWITCKIFADELRGDLKVQYYPLYNDVCFRLVKEGTKFDLVSHSVSVDNTFAKKIRFLPDEHSMLSFLVPELAKIASTQEDLTRLEEIVNADT